jgi:ParB-like chromosome segregation protein Spo0J
MMKLHRIAVERVHVPAKRRRTLDPAKVVQLAESILEDGQTTPILVRSDGERYVLVEGLHRLEAVKALGEDSIDGYLVQSRRR